MSRVLRIALICAVLVVLAGAVLPFIIKSREKNDRVICQNHLRELGLIGVRHAAAPGTELPLQPRDELPPGTFLNSALTPDQRMSWYAYMLNVLNEGPSMPDPQTKYRRPVGLAELLRGFDAKAPWDSASNMQLACYRLTVAICPAQVREYAAGTPVPSNYVANGGLGLDTPAMSPDRAGKFAGAYWYDGPTPLRLITDGQSQTIQFLETNLDTGPWLRGGSATLRGTEVANEPYLGVGRPFGGCHPGGCFAAMADGSVRFITETIEPAVFRALLTRAGSPEELNLDAP